MRIDSLDGVRGFAILQVMFFHTYLPYSWGGFIGVDVFFVLSGFLITYLLLKEYDNYQSVSFRKFYMRRLLRLAPAILIVAFSYYVYSQLFMSGEDKDSGLKVSLSAVFYISNWVRAFDSYSMSHLAHTWSLAIEEQYYLIWPLFMVAILKMKQQRLYLSLIILILIIAVSVNRTLIILQEVTIESIHRVYFGTDTHSDGLLIGSLVAVLYSTYRDRIDNFFIRWQAMAKYLPLLTAIFFIGSMLIFTMWVQGVYIWFLQVLAMVSAILVLYLFSSQKINQGFNVFTLPPLIWIGKISYGLYLWHWFIYRILNDMDIKNGLYIGLIGGAISIVLAALSYYYVEKPILRLKKRYAA